MKWIVAPFQKLFKFFRQLSSSSASGEPEVMRFITLYGVVSLSILALILLLTKGEFDPLAYGGAVGATGAGAGAGSAAKNIINRKRPVNVEGNLNAENIENAEINK